MTEQETLAKKNLLIATIVDSVVDIFYYERKNDDELSHEDVDYLIRGSHITREEIVNAFNGSLDEIFS